MRYKCLEEESLKNVAADSGSAKTEVEMLIAFSGSPRGIDHQPVAFSKTTLVSASH